MGCRILWILCIVAFSDVVSESIISHFYDEDVDQLNTYPETVSYRPKMPAVIPMPQFFMCSRQETCTHVIWYERIQENKSMSYIDSVKLFGETIVVWKKAVHKREEEKQSLGGCAVPFEKIGCYKDIKDSRTLPEMLFTERDAGHSLSNGHEVDWIGWETYVPVIVCRCAVKAKALGYTVFGVQNFAECWSGVNSAVEYDQHGPGDLDDCKNVNYDSCLKDDHICAGKELANFIYKLV